MSLFAHQHTDEDPETGETGLVLDPCADCGHSLLDHWTPNTHPCTRDDCLCPAYRQDLIWQHPIAAVLDPWEGKV